MTRVATYIDGFNLYFGLRAAGLKRLYWLDVRALSRSLLKPDQTLGPVHYFTARLRKHAGNADSVQRQADYLDALATLPGLTVHEGHFLVKEGRCKRCGATWATYEEKMSDVNIAVQLLLDAVDDRYDTALVISGDSDLTTPVSRVRERFPGKRVVIAFPPRRNSNELLHAASGHLRIGEDKLRKSQLPNPVVTPSAVALQRPSTWR